MRSLEQILFYTNSISPGLCHRLRTSQHWEMFGIKEWYFARRAGKIGTCSDDQMILLLQIKRELFNICLVHFYCYSPFFSSLFPPTHSVSLSLSLLVLLLFYLPPTHDIYISLISLNVRTCQDTGLMKDVCSKLPYNVTC